ncbi:lipolytic protein G-D-S-L family [Coraliomargarita sinensis]|uniref:Lipolytic protein G-D-S-L family n=1 Tax=Coraliomargarita sinensis TaxID=2174842 RepID=A0A317ZFF7_9BACT|nr:SGNH/GDSL hydrolase family protein [Coraliomargarita sinensis]PXA04080.1 lipolytic protein G-D-S-L family [Coraliomargarita sinensis]
MPQKRTATSSDLFSRRSLLKQGLALGAFGAMSPLPTYAKESPSPIKLQKGDVILFQGDSITDAGRKKEVGHANHTGALGKSYAAMLAGQLHAAYPGLDLQIYNRGISGNKIPDLAARWHNDAIDLKPKVLSILVGINDLWHTVAFGSKYKGTVEDYETGYRELIERSQKEIPGVRIVICEPFELRNWKEFDPYREAAKRVAEEKHLTFVPFHSEFQKVAENPNSKFWAWDGIHPTIPGHALMCEVWREVVGI